MNIQPHPATTGFTRIDLMLLAASLALLTGLCLPALSGPNSRQDRVLCSANLQRIGQGFLAWSEDFGDLFPGVLRQPVGGSSGSVTAVTHFQTLSNFLSSPRLLICPASRRNPASSFSRVVDANLSYLVGAHATPEKAFEILSGDSDIEGGNPATCSYLGQVLVTSFEGLSGQPSTYTAGWSGTNHLGSGNLLLTDGSVAWGDGYLLRQTLAQSRREGQTSVHALFPR